MKRLREEPKPPKPRRRRPEITAEDQALWAHVLRSTKPLPGKRAPSLPIAPAAAPSGDTPALPARKSEPAPPKARPVLPLTGVEKELSRQLLRGRAAVDARIDLHGMRQSEAHAALIAFIHRAQQQDARVVLVITGKGAPGAGDWSTPGDSGTRGVLRRLVPHWLADPGLRALVIGFEQAGRAHGGDGALYVRIRRRRSLV